MDKNVIKGTVLSGILGSVILGGLGIVNAQTYSVDSGDTVYKISKEYGTTVKNIKKLNKLDDINLNHVGDKLEIKNKKLDKDKKEITELENISNIDKDAQFHIVKPKDTLYNVSKKYGISIEKLKEINGLTSNKLKVGDILSLKGEPLKLDDIKNDINKLYQISEKQTVKPRVKVEGIKTEDSYISEDDIKTSNIETNNKELSQEDNVDTTQSKQEQKTVDVKGDISSEADSRNWEALAFCESRGIPTIVDATGTYHGLYQFDVTTWRGVGGTGLPSQATPEEQTKRAKILYSMRGSQPWPVCGAKL